MPKQAALQVTFLGIGAQRHKIELVRVLQELLRELGLRGGQRTIKVGERLPLPVIEPTFDLAD